MSDKVDVEVEVSGWTKEQTAYMLFEKIMYMYDRERPQNVDGALALYAKCLSAVKFSAVPEVGRMIGKMAV